jgi:uncharacterized linocin/CFP29 family protein
MDRLLRAFAPISALAWKEIEKEATRTLKTTLAARRLVDFVGPVGWRVSAVSAGRTEAITPPRSSGVEAKLRRVHRLVEFRAAFEFARDEVDAIDRGAKDADLTAVTSAAQQIALAEDGAVFLGAPEAGIVGICNSDNPNTLPISEDYVAYPTVVATALTRLRQAGIDGPFAIALGNRCYTGLNETTEGGYPVIQHVHRLLDGPVIWAPALDGAVVLSMRAAISRWSSGRISRSAISITTPRRFSSISRRA